MYYFILSTVFLLSKVSANPIFLVAHSSDNCPTGFSQPTGANWTNCYKINLDFKRRKDAASQCKKNGGMLASVPNAFVNSYIYSLASQSKATSVWLGVECFNADKNTCLNDDSTIFQFDNFYGGQPNVDGACVYLSAIGRDSQKWSTFDCDQKFQYVCEIAAVISPTNNVETTTSGLPLMVSTTTVLINTTNIALKCPEGYSEFQNMCYIFSYMGIEEIPATFASTICKDVPGGHLATIYSAQLNSFMWSIRPTGVVTETAFGLSCPNITFDGDRSSCQWEDGTPFDYNAFIIPVVPHYTYGGGCCDYNSGDWWDCYPCTMREFDSYICQAPLQ